MGLAKTQKEISSIVRTLFGKASRKGRLASLIEMLRSRPLVVSVPNVGVWLVTAAEGKMKIEASPKDVPFDRMIYLEITEDELTWLASKTNFSILDGLRIKAAIDAGKIQIAGLSSGEVQLLVSMLE